MSAWNALGRQFGVQTREFGSPDYSGNTTDQALTGRGYFAHGWQVASDPRNREAAHGLSTRTFGSFDHAYSTRGSADRSPKDVWNFWKKFG